MAWNPRLVPVSLLLALAACSGGANDGGGGGGQVPAVPTLLQGFATGTSEIVLSWVGAPAGQDGFIVERELPSGFQPLVRLPGNQFTYADTGLSAATTYRYRVFSFNGSGNSDATAPVSVPTLDSPPSLGSVTPNSASGVGGEIVTLKGSNFGIAPVASHTVVFGGVRATGVTIVDDQTITCILPPSVGGVVDVLVGNANGVATLIRGFTYFGEPARVSASDRGVGKPVPGGEEAASPRILCEGAFVYAVFQSDRNGIEDVFFNRSPDGGLSWFNNDIRLDTDNLGGLSKSPDLARGSSSLVAVWQDSRDGFDDIYARVSFDDGLSWGVPDVRLDDDVAGAASSSDPLVVASGERVHALWLDDRNGFSDVYYRGSMDGGFTWSATDVAVNTGPLGVNTSASPAASAEGDDVYVVYTDDRNGGTDIFFNRSSDAGATWLPADVRLDTDAPGAGASTAPTIAANGDDVFVMWVDDRNGSTDIYFNRSGDRGATWLPADVRIDADVAGAANSSDVQLVFSSGALYTVWSDDRAGQADILFRGSLDLGATWSPEIRLDTDVAGAAASYAPSLTANPRGITVVWLDDRNGLSDVMLNRSTDGGGTWFAADSQVDTDGPGASAADSVQVCGSDVRFTVIWRDMRSGQGEIRQNRRVP